jgi:hypothetical protein
VRARSKDEIEAIQTEVRRRFNRPHGGWRWGFGDHRGDVFWLADGRAPHLCVAIFNDRRRAIVVYEPVSRWPADWRELARFRRRDMHSRKDAIDNMHGSVNSQSWKLKSPPEFPIRRFGLQSPIPTVSSRAT